MYSDSEELEEERELLLPDLSFVVSRQFMMRNVGFVLFFVYTN